MTKLTKKLIDTLEPKAKNYVIWDDEIRGFGIRVWPSNKKTYIVKYRNKYGRQRKLKIGVQGAITPEQAREQARQRMADITQGKDPAEHREFDRSSLSVSDLCDKVIKEYTSKRCKAGTRKNYQGITNKWVKPHIGKLKINAVQRSDIARLHQIISEKAPYNANRVLAVLSKMFNLAEMWGLRDNNSNPCKHVQKNPESKKDRFLSNIEIAGLGKVLDEATMTQTESHHAIAAIKLLLYTGCRLREILDLKWEYVDLEGQCFKLPDSKTGAKRVHFSPIVTEILRNITREDSNPYVIIGRIKGKQLNNLQKPWSRIRKAVGLGDDVRLHDLRHTFASIGAANGLTLPMIGALLGHSQPQTTARYAHLLGEPVKNAANVINMKMTEAMQHDRANISQIAL